MYIRIVFYEVISIKFAKEGFFWVLPSFLLYLGWHIYSLPTKYNPWTYFLVITLPTTVGLILLASFFRDPERHIPPEFDLKKDVLSPCDGNICAIQQELDQLAIYIEMHFNNVHVTRAHIAGTVQQVQQHRGLHHLVYFMKKQRKSTSYAIKKNARVIIDFINSENQKFSYYLICGGFFRRARAYIRPGDQVIPGQRIGIIVFGSTVKITLPHGEYQVIAQIGQKVRAGETIICRRATQIIPDQKISI